MAPQKIPFIPNIACSYVSLCECECSPQNNSQTIAALYPLPKLNPQPNQLAENPFSNPRQKKLQSEAELCRQHPHNVRGKIIISLFFPFFFRTHSHTPTEIPAGKSFFLLNPKHTHWHTFSAADGGDEVPLFCPPTLVWKRSFLSISVQPRFDQFSGGRVGFVRPLAKEKIDFSFFFNVVVSRCYLSTKVGENFSLLYCTHTHGRWDKLCLNWNFS